MTEKKLRHFGPNDRKYRLMRIVTPSLNTTVRQMTEMSQQKWPKRLREKKTNSQGPISFWNIWRLVGSGADGLFM